MSIFVSGSLAYDRIMNFPGYFSDNILPDKIHILNVSFGVKDLRQNFGGTAGNIAYNLGLLGEKPKILGSAGADFFPYRDWLIQHAVDVRYVKMVKEVQCATAHIITDKANNQITAFYMGAMNHRGPYLAKKIFNKAQWAIVAPGNTHDMVYYSRMFQKNRVPYIFDPGQQITALTKQELIRSLSGAKILIANDYEASLILKKIGWKKKKLLQVIGILVTTLGENGSLIEYKDVIIKIPCAIPKKVLDPTGAGDAYRAGFIKGLARGYPLPKVGRLASLVAVYTVETHGTQTHTFTWKSLSERYKKNFGEIL